MAEGANGATKLKGRDWADESDDEGSSDAVGGGASKVGEQEQEQEQVGNEDAVPVDGAEVEAEAEAVAASTGGGDDAAAAAAAAAAANAKKDQDDAAVEAEAARIARLMLQPETESDRHARLKVVQGNPSSHLSSVKTFDELNLPDPLLRGIQSMGFEKPSEIQEHALPLLLREPPEHLIAQAQSGSGKTVAFCLGLLLRIDTSKNVTQAMIITPTRELAVQCYHQTIVPMAQFLSPELRVKMALSGEMMDRSAKVSEHIVIGTPGKIEDWMKRRIMDPRSVKVFVLDEADEMLKQSGFGDNCKRIKKYLNHPHQSLLFSATFPPDVKDFATKLIKGPINTIYVKSDEALVLDVITQLWIDLRPEHRADARISLLKDLYDLLEMGQSIIFCRTRNEADIIQETLTQSGFKCSNLHSGLKGLDRDECMEAFRVGKNKVLITTNVLARGVDIPAVSLVVNYDMPVTHERPPEPDSETYLHRIGRTGRFGRKGLAINLIHDQESYQILKSIERHFSPEVEMITEAPADIEALEELLAAKMK